MIKLKIEKGCEPVYMSQYSSACDLVSRIDMIIPPKSIGKVPTGVWIEDLSLEGKFLELQIRARSGLSLKGINLANGIGTIDADFKDEICVLIKNDSNEDFVIKKGNRIAQMSLGEVLRIPNLSVKGERKGGFGSTGV